MHMHDKMEYVKSPRRGCGRTAVLLNFCYSKY